MNTYGSFRLQMPYWDGKEIWYVLSFVLASEEGCVGK